MLKQIIFVSQTEQVYEILLSLDVYFIKKSLV